jgi:hypothetical protein
VFFFIFVGSNINVKVLGSNEYVFEFLLNAYTSTNIHCNNAIRTIIDEDKLNIQLIKRFDYIGDKDPEIAVKLIEKYNCNPRHLFKQIREHEEKNCPCCLSEGM